LTSRTPTLSTYNGKNHTGIYEQINAVIYRTILTISQNEPIDYI